jgi:branched-chain amino acid transport system substrate-binding protein
MKLPSLVILACVCALALAGPGRTPVTAADPYELNVLLPLTGPLAFVGASQSKALLALQDVVNSGGGIKGRPLKLVILDDGSNPQTAIELTTQLIAKHVPVILGSAAAGSCSAMFPLVDKAGPVTYCFSPTVHPRSGGYSFMSGPAIEDTQPVLLRFFRARGLTNIALLASNDANGQDFERQLDTTLALPEFRTMTVVAREHFNLSDISVAGQIARIKAAKPGFLIAFTSGTPFGTVLRGASDAGLDVPIYSSGGNMAYAQMAQYASFLPKELYLNAARGVVFDATATGKVKAAQGVFFDAMRKAGIRPEYSHLIVWDPAMLVIDALRAVGPDAGADRLHDYIEHLQNWTGAEGSYDFTSGNQRGATQPAVALVRWDAANATWLMADPNVKR